MKWIISPHLQPGSMTLFLLCIQSKSPTCGTAPPTPAQGEKLPHNSPALRLVCSVILEPVKLTHSINHLVGKSLGPNRDLPGVAVVVYYNILPQAIEFLFPFGAKTPELFPQGSNFKLRLYLPFQGDPVFSWFPMSSLKYATLGKIYCFVL